MLLQFCNFDVFSSVSVEFSCSAGKNDFIMNPWAKMEVFLPRDKMTTILGLNVTLRIPRFGPPSRKIVFSVYLFDFKSRAV